MYKNKILFLVIIGFIVFRFMNQGDEESKKVNDKLKTENTKIIELLEIANSYKGVSYKAGGTTKKGMDCSGLVNTSFKKIGIQLPRSSKAISTKGTEILFNEVKAGDLLFFDIARLKSA